MSEARLVGLLLSAGLAVALGCGGSGGMGGGGTAGSGGGAATLQLVQTVPADLASEVPTDIVVTAEFETALNEATVTTSSFSLRRDGGADVGGSVAVTGETASYTPARTLGLLSSYTATLTTAIENLSGQPLEMSHTWSFSTRDGQWGEPVEISNAGIPFDPQVALDPNGNAVARLVATGRHAQQHPRQSVRVSRSGDRQRHGAPVGAARENGLQQATEAEHLDDTQDAPHLFPQGMARVQVWDTCPKWIPQLRFTGV